MKTIKYILLSLGLAIFIISLNNCKDCDDCLESNKERLTNYLINKSDDWTLKSITVPANSATTEDQWINFNLLNVPQMLQPE